eukprot:TRINITY_DN3452_c0_g1_i2.p1 TRINITY_DN3452_c0_g1~~TRINITY_DN3452_c0_g1_i2.p1  ORF type:complete len:259 (+),score=64.14 TRINITY_DN3452_c0_g1_i2:90-866(+)
MLRERYMNHTCRAKPAPTRHAEGGAHERHAKKKRKFRRAAEALATVAAEGIVVPAQKRFETCTTSNTRTHTNKEVQISFVMLVTPPPLQHLQGLFRAIGESIDDAGFFVHDNYCVPLYINSFAESCFAAPRTMIINRDTRSVVPLRVTDNSGNAIDEWIRDKSLLPGAWQRWQYLLEKKHSSLCTLMNTRLGPTLTFNTACCIRDPTTGLEFNLVVFHCEGWGRAVLHPELLHDEDPQLPQLAQEVASCLNMPPEELA